MSILEALKEVSILIGIWVAIYGIDSWRREYIEKRKIELAEEVLALFYEVKDVIRYIRHPVSLSKETEDIERGPNETDAQYQARKNASVVFKRYNEHIQLFSRLRSLRYRFMAQVGKEKAQPFDDLKKILNEIMTSARMLARLWARDSFRTEAQWKEHQSQIDKYESIFWEGLEEQDPINPRLEAIILEIEKTCREMISGQGTLYALLNRKIF